MANDLLDDDCVVGHPVNASVEVIQNSGDIAIRNFIVAVMKILCDVVAFVLCTR